MFLCLPTPAMTLPSSYLLLWNLLLFQGFTQIHLLWEVLCEHTSPIPCLHPPLDHTSNWPFSDTHLVPSLFVCVDLTITCKFQNLTLERSTIVTSSIAPQDLNSVSVKEHSQLLPWFITILFAIKIWVYRDGRITTVWEMFRITCFNWLPLFEP